MPALSELNVKQQILLTAGGLLLLCSLLFFGTIEPQKSTLPHVEKPTASFNITEHLQHAKEKLTASQIAIVNQLENNISRGDVKSQLQKQYAQLANFWKDSIKAFEVYAYYLSEAAKLDNSEKNLTFAAQLILANMRGEEHEALKIWEAETASDLFERALKLDPDNDNLKVGLGSCYVYGKGMIGDAAETMKGIQQLLQVVRKDSGNMKAQLVLGIGGVISRQYDKAVERLNKAVAFDANNLEAVSWLADAYAGAGDKANAVKWDALLQLIRYAFA